jgi:hypothetical protein
MFKLGFLSLIALAGASNAATHSTVIDVPMHFYGTRPAVEVRVNREGPFLFLIDTGAAGEPARADSSMVKRLSIRIGGSAEASDASGAEASVDRVVLESVGLGGLTVHNVAALSRDYGGPSYLPRIDGILGIEFFRDKLLTLDFPHRRVIIADGALPKPDGESVLSYELIDGNPYIDAELGGRRIKAIVDTGDIRAVDVPSTWLQTMHLSSFPRVVGTGSGVSGSIGLREVELADPLKIGRYSFTHPLVTFADEYREANIGSTIWQHFAITIDQKNRRIRLIRAD